MNNNQEIFRAVDGYIAYEVSNHGRIRNAKTGKMLRISRDKDGYKLITLCLEGKPKTHKVHRLVAGAFIPNTKNAPVVDHINGDKTNNMATNLRWATKSQNSMNMKVRNLANKTSRFKGVRYHKASNKWNARISIQGKMKSLGYFKAEEDAARAYNEAATKQFQEFAKLNNI